MRRGVLVAAALFYTAFIARSAFRIGDEIYFSLLDDGMISMRFAKHLAAGHGLVWNAGGERVEGYSNFLWTIWIALGMRLGVSPEAWSAAWGITELTDEEAEVQRSALERAKRVIAIADGSKIGAATSAVVGPADQLAALVTDAAAPDAELGRLRGLGIEIVVARQRPRSGDTRGDRADSASLPAGRGAAETAPTGLTTTLRSGRQAARRNP